MAVKVMIPTPLRAWYAGKQDSVDLRSAAGTVGEALSALTSKFAELKKHLYSEDGRLREQRQCLRERRRHSLLAERPNRCERRRHDQHRSLHRRRRIGGRNIRTSILIM